MKCLIREYSTPGSSQSTTRTGNPLMFVAPSLVPSLPSLCSLSLVPCGIKVTIIFISDKFENHFFNFGSAGNGKDCGSGFVYASDPNDLSVPFINNCSQAHVSLHAPQTSSPPRVFVFQMTKTFELNIYRTLNFPPHMTTKTSSKPSFGAHLLHWASVSFG